MVRHDAGTIMDEDLVARIDALDVREQEQLLQRLMSTAGYRPPVPRVSGDVADALQDFFRCYFRRGEDPVHTDRTGALPELISGLGSHFKLQHRPTAVDDFLRALSCVVDRQRILQRNLPTAHKEDVLRDLHTHPAFIAVPGAGKTTAGLVAVDEGLQRIDWLLSNPNEDSPLEREQLPALKELMTVCSELSLVYRFNASVEGNARHALELPSGSRPGLHPAQALAFRLLHCVCPTPKGTAVGTAVPADAPAATLADTYEYVKTLPPAVRNMLLQHLEVRDVVAALARWHEVDRVCLHFIYDEAQAGFEQTALEQAAPGSTAGFFKDMMSAHHAQLGVYAPHLLVLTICGTRLDIALTAEGHVSGSGRATAYGVHLGLMGVDAMMEIAGDLLVRAGGQPGQQLHEHVEVLARYAGGNLRHFEMLLTAAACIRGGVPIDSEGHLTGHSRADLHSQHLRLLLTKGLGAPEQLTQAVNSASELLAVRVTSVQRWATEEAGSIIMALVGSMLLGRAVRRTDTVADLLGPQAAASASSRHAALTLGKLEGESMLQLVPIDDKATDFSIKQYTISLPWLTYVLWERRLAASNLLSATPAASLLSDAQHIMCGHLHELVDVGTLHLRVSLLMRAMGRKTCSLAELLPLTALQRQQWQDIEIMLPSDVGHVEHLRTYTSGPKLKIQLHKFHKEDGPWLFLGPGQEKRPDWWAFFRICEGGQQKLLVLQGQSKSMKDLGATPVSMKLVADELGKRFKHKHADVFVMVTDMRTAGLVVPTEMHKCVVMVGAEQHDRWYSPAGGLRREAIAAVQRKRKLGT